MSVEIIGLLYHHLTSRLRDIEPRDFDLQALMDLASTHEASGYDTVLVSQSATMPDPSILGAYVCAITTRLKFMLAHRPGFIAPTMAARMFATIDRLSGGRAKIHIISGASDAEMARDGDYSTKEQRYRRSAEYTQIMRRVWSSDTPFDFDGEFYRFRQAFSDVKPQRPEGPVISWAGASPSAFQTAAACADVYAMVGGTPDTAREYVQTVLGEAARRGRAMKFTITLCVVLGETEAQAWRNAHAVLARIEARLAASATDSDAALQKPASSAFRRMLETSLEGDVVGRNLWMAINRVSGGVGNNTTVVGTVDQVVETLMDYHGLGFTGFLLRGFEPLHDAEVFGRELIPRFREAVALREAALREPA